MVGILSSQCNRKSEVGQKLFFLTQNATLLDKAKAVKGLRLRTPGNRNRQGANHAVYGLTQAEGSI